MLEPHGEPTHIVKTLERPQPQIESFPLNSAPRIYANPSLPDTAMVMTVPFSGVEWQTGNVTRMLGAFFAQHVNEKPIELEMIANTRRAIYWGIEDSHDEEFKIERVPAEQREKVTKEISQMKEANYFLRQVIDIQKLSLEYEGLKPIHWIKRGELKRRISSLVDAEKDGEKRALLQKAVSNSTTHSLSLIDVTETNLGNTLYQGEIIDSLRTLGVDVACARSKNEKIIIGLYDMDTVPINNQEFSAMIDAYKNGNQFLLTELGYRTPGDSLEVVANAPDVSRLVYNQYIQYTGSPQISFTKKAYEEKLKAIVDLGLFGEEDRDTAFRLAYYYEESSQDLGNRTPIHLTVMRENGFWDGLRGLKKDSPDEAQPTTRDPEIFRFKRQVENALDKLPTNQAEKAREELSNARKEYEREAKKINLFSRNLLKNCMSAISEGYISLKGESLTIDADKITKRFGGTLLNHYLRYNPEVIKEILKDSKKQETIKHILNLENAPPEWRPTTRFDWAMREYFGEYGKLEDITRLDDNGENAFFSLKTVNRADKDNVTRQYYELSEKADSPATVSTHYALNAETYALSHIHRKYIDHEEFLQEKRKPTSFVGPFDRIHDQELSRELFTNFEERMKEVKAFVTAPY